MLLSPRSRLVLAPVLAALWAAIGLAAWPQTQPQNSPQKSSKSVTTRGKHTFTSTCAACHGLDGRGGERAPNIAESPKVQKLSDAQIFHIIENGVPGTGMPAFHSLESSQIRAVITYIHTLQGQNKTAALPGNPDQGKTLFFGKAACSQCHMVTGEGGFIASDLSEYGRVHQVEQIRGAILDPASTGRQARLVTVTLHSGEKYVGRVRDEDNFSVQLQTLDGQFYFLSKSEIDQMQFDSQSLMPSDYGSRLDARELDDLISYLMKVAGADRVPVPTKVHEWEE